MCIYRDIKSGLTGHAEEGQPPVLVHSMA
jgi:hypothetical protein